LLGGKQSVADISQAPIESETRARFVIASEAWQSSALSRQSGLLRRSAPRNDAAGLMADTRTMLYEAETPARFVIASVANQSNALSGQSGLLRRSAPRNDVSMLTFAANSKGVM
jgi:hypothetical protein